MRLPEIAIKRPVFMTMIALALIVFGVVALPRMAIDLFPKIDFPVVNITTKLVGASPEIMEVDVTDIIEEAVNTINGVKSITHGAWRNIPSLPWSSILSVMSTSRPGCAR